MNTVSPYDMGFSEYPHAQASAQKPLHLVAILKKRIAEQSKPGAANNIWSPYDNAKTMQTRHMGQAESVG